MRACILAIPLLILLGCEPSYTSVTISPDSVDLTAKGATHDLTAKGNSANGKSVPIAAVDWSSSDPSVATVEEGKVTALRSGEAIITVATGKLKGTAKVTVSITQSVTLPQASVEMIGILQKATLTVVVKDDNDQVIPDAVVFWRTSDPSIVSVSGGELTSVGPGTAKITADHAGVTGTAEVTVKLPDFAKLSVTPAKQLFGPGEGLKFTAAPLDAAGKPVAMVPVAWSISDEKVATVTPEGLVTAVGKGKAKLIATSGARSASAEIVVVAE